MTKTDTHDVLVELNLGGPAPRATRALLNRYPELTTHLRDASVVLVEASLGMFVGQRYRDLEEIRSAIESKMMGADPTNLALAKRPGVCPYFIGQVRCNVARVLAGSVSHVASMPVLGWCGFYEGGIDFFAAEGVHIETEQWERARDHLLLWCRRRIR